MSELRIKVTIEGMSVELEGDAETVKEIFASLKENGMGYMNTLSKPVAVISKKTTVEESTPDFVSVEEELEQEDIPSLENVVLSGGPSTEVEWILVYAFYCSEQGKKFFTRDDLRQCYKDTKRYTRARSKNFATNIKSLISEKYISAVNMEDFRIERSGLDFATKIIKGEKVKVSSKKKLSKAKK